MVTVPRRGRLGDAGRRRLATWPAGRLTGGLLLPVFVPATRRALSAEPVDVIVGGVQRPEVAAARSEVAAQVPAAQVHSFQRPVLVLNPRLDWED